MSKLEQKKTKSNKGTMNVFKSLNEKIIGMGYTYSMMTLLKTYLFFVFAIVALGYFHQLKYYYIILLIICFVLLLPFSIYAQYKYLFEQKRFQELCVYLKNMKINFKQYKKILIALTETKENFSEEDRIYPLIDQAIEDIKNGISYRDALDKIEIPFKNSYITKLHAYIILGEMEGGSAVFEALDSIDYENWRTDTYLFQTQKFKSQNQNGYYTIFGLLASLSVIFLFQKIINDPATASVLGNVFDSMLFQISTFIYIFVDLVSYILIKTIITGKWIREDE